MKKIYSVEGILNKGFVGQIAYTICLDQSYEGMSISFDFDKQYLEDVTEDIKKQFIIDCRGNYTAHTANDACLIDALKHTKTELQIVITMNDKFIGGVHRQDNPKHIHFSKTYTTEGCIPQESIHGVLRITVIAFSVIQDHTHYHLSLFAHPKEANHV